MVNRMFSEADLQAVREGVKKAERHTRGEIVPMVIGASAVYREARHFMGLAMLFLALVIWLVLRLEHLQWGGLNPGWLILYLGAAYLLGSYSGSFSTLTRAFTSNERMAMKVRLRAEQIFYQRGLHRTYGRTAVLILVSILERRVQILADQAINEKVPQGTWEKLANELSLGIKQGRPAEALCETIAQVAEILRRHFPATDKDNPNELGDELIKDPSV
jgi:putative membrane protein